jgi:hypothetical protein
MSVGVHKIAIYFSHRVPLANSTYRYYGEIKEAGAEYPTNGYEMELASESRWEPTLTAGTIKWIEVACGKLNLQGIPATAKVKAFWTKSEHVIDDEVAANTDIHASVAGCPIYVDTD